MAKVICNGISINYRCVGEGPDVVLIHGLAANRAFWHLNVLLPLAREYRVTVYDLRGHGYSDMPSSGYTTADMAKDLFGLTGHLGITKAHLVGHSFGGTVALNYAALHPEQVASLTVADSRIRAVQPQQRLTDWPEWEKIKEKFDEHGLSIPEGETEIGLYLLERLASPDLQYARTNRGRSPLFIPFSGWGGGNRSAERWLALLGTTTARRDLCSVAGLTKDKIRSISQPTLAMYGERSLVMQSFLGLRELLRDCRSVIVPGAGHFFPVQRPGFFVNTVLDFLRDVDCRAVGESRACASL